MIIAFDYHDTISVAPDLCRLIMTAQDVKEVHVITGTPCSRLAKVEDGLQEMGLLKYITKVWGAFEYEPGTRTKEHFQKVADFKHSVLTAIGADVFFEDNPYYIARTRNDFRVLQLVLSDNELTKECSINTTANLQCGQFDQFHSVLEKP